MSSIEDIGRALALVMVAYVVLWLAHGLYGVIRDGIQFRRGMRAQAEANRLELEREMIEEFRKAAPLTSIAVNPFPLAAPVIERAMASAVCSTCLRVGREHDDWCPQREVGRDNL